MKKNAQTATAVIAISAILLLTVTAETAILSSGIWEREKYTLAFLVLAAGIVLVYLLFKAFEEKTLSDILIFIFSFCYPLIRSIEYI